MFAGDSLTDKLPSKDRFFFAGWYDAAENGNKLSVVPSTNGKDITVYARWDSTLTSTEGRLTVSYMEDEEGVELTVRALPFEKDFPAESSCYVTESTTGLSIFLGDKAPDTYSSPQESLSSSNRETKVKFPFVEKDKVYQFTLNYGTAKVAEHIETVSFISSSKRYELSDYIYNVDLLKKAEIECNSKDYTAQFSAKGRTFFKNKETNFDNVSKAWGSIDVISGAVAGENNVTIGSLNMYLKSTSYSYDFSKLFAQDDPYDIEGYLGDDCVDLAANPTWYCEGNVKFIINSTTYPYVYTLGGLFKPESGKEAKSYLYGKKASASLTVTFDKSTYEDLDVSYTFDSTNSKKITFTLNDPNNYFSGYNTNWYVGDIYENNYKTFTFDFSEFLSGSYPVRVSAYSNVNNKLYEKLLIVKISDSAD